MPVIVGFPSRRQDVGVSVSNHDSVTRNPSVTVTAPPPVRTVFARSAEDYAITGAVLLPAYELLSPRFDRIIGCRRLEWRGDSGAVCLVRAVVDKHAVDRVPVAGTTPRLKAFLCCDAVERRNRRRCRRRRNSGRWFRRRGRDGGAAVGSGVGVGSDVGVGTVVAVGSGVGSRVGDGVGVGGTGFTRYWPVGTMPNVRATTGASPSLRVRNGCSAGSSTALPALSSPSSPDGLVTVSVPDSHRSAIGPFCV